MACYVFIGRENVAKIVIMNVISMGLHDFMPLKLCMFFKFGTVFVI